MLEGNCRRPAAVRSPENIDAFRVDLQRSPSKSTRQAAAQLGISVQQILKSDLNLYPYKLTRVLPKLNVQNEHQRMAFAEWARNNEASFNNVWFSDEAHFHLDGVVNKHNVRFWASENPRVIHEKVRHAPRITAWVASSSHGLLGPISFEETVNSVRYLSMLHNTSAPHLLATGLQWLMQDGAKPHTANVVLDFLHYTFLIVSHVDRTGPRIVLI
jgi:hypothetical protein